MAPLTLQKRMVRVHLSTFTWVGLGIGAALLLILFWLLLHALRACLHKRSLRKRNLPVIVVESPLKETAMRHDRNMLGVSNEPATFSRANLTASVILPAKALTRPSPPPSDYEIVAHHKGTNSIPRPFARRSVSLTKEMDYLSPGDSALQLTDLVPPRSLTSHASVRFSVASTTSFYSTASGTSGYSPVHKKVRQVFSPVLPDEVVLSVGETVTIVQSYPDGWCIVGRDGYSGEPELGAVPAWCFAKPIKGLKAERPLRVNSLGVAVEVNPPGPNDSDRNDVISWSNF